VWFLKKLFGKLAHETYSLFSLWAGIVRDQVISVLLLLQTTESHFGTWNILLWVLEVLKEGGLVPNDTLLLVGICVLEASDLTGLTAEKAKQVRSDFVGSTFLKGVALLTAGFEKVRTLGVISYIAQLC